MRPDTPRNSGPIVPERRAMRPSDDQSHRAAHEAAANIARGQLDSIYSGNTHTLTPQTTPVLEPENPVKSSQPLAQEDAPNPYERTHSPYAQVQAEQWRQYHSAWQDYYQKYYERYYVGQVHQARQALEARAAEAARAPETTAAPTHPETVTKDEALYDLRSRLLHSIQSSAKKARKSRHFIPISAAFCVVLLFMFLQYNRVLFANVNAYISPGNIDPANIIVDPITEVAVSNEPKLIIPKINVDVPVVYNTKPDHNSQMKAMEKGVAWFGIPGANSKPGQIGNTVLSGHSSNDIIDQGDYKFIFARLDQLKKGDTVYINYQGTRYIYTVTKKEVVKPTEVNKLVYDTDKPMLTLITCTPIGTSLNRLLVTAEQVSPNPSGAAAAPSKNSAQSAAMPGNSPTFLQRLFGASED